MRVYTYRLYPTRSQERELRRWLVVCKEIWNAALEQRITWWREGGWIIRARSGWHREYGVDLSLSQTKQLQEARKEHAWLAGMPAPVQNHVLAVLDYSFQVFRRHRKTHQRGGHPRFRRSWRTVTFPSYGKEQTHRWNGSDERWGYLTLRGLGQVRVKLGDQHRIPDDADLGVCTVTLSETGRWQLSILDRQSGSEDLPRTGRAVGIARGDDHLLVASDGQVFEDLTSVAAPASEMHDLAEFRLSNAQWRSAGHGRARMRLARARHRIAADRHRRIGEIARALVEQYDLIVIEHFDARVKREAANCDVSDPREVVAARAWAVLERRLRERCERHKKALAVVGATAPPQCCPNCGFEAAGQVARGTFCCDKCSRETNLAVMAAAEMLRHSLEPDAKNECYGAEDLIQMYFQEAKAA